MEKEKSEHQRVLVKGTCALRHVLLRRHSQKDQELFNLDGGEYFLMKAKPEKGIILLKLVEFADEEQEKESETK